MKDDIERTIRESYVLRRVSDRLINNLEKRYKLHEQSQALRDLLDRDANDVLGLIVAAMDALTLAGETLSGDREAIANLQRLAEARVHIAYDDANLQTVLLNYDELLRSPQQAAIFIDSISDEARQAIYVALMEMMNDEHTKD